MTPEGVRQISSLLAIDASIIHPDKGSAPVEQPPSERPSTATTPSTRAESSFNEMIIQRETLKYVDSINQLVNDLKTGRNDDSASSFAMYLDRYARKIDCMFVHYVDPDISGLGKKDMGSDPVYCLQTGLHGSGCNSWPDPCESSFPVRFTT